METYTFLFDSHQSAQEVAEMLQAEWDGCNAIEVTQLDEATLNTAAELAKSSYCRLGEHVLLFEEFIKAIQSDVQSERKALILIDEPALPLFGGFTLLPSFLNQRKEENSLEPQNSILEFINARLERRNRISDYPIGQEEAPQTPFCSEG